jgi:hypothetical protein
LGGELGCIDVTIGRNCRLLEVLHHFLNFLGLLLGPFCPHTVHGKIGFERLKVTVEGGHVIFGGVSFQLKLFDYSLKFITCNELTFIYSISFPV